MGWGSGVYVFDEVVECILNTMDIKNNESDIYKSKEIIKCLISALQNQDWDTESDSNFIENPIVKECLLVIDKETWEDFFNEI